MAAPTTAARVKKLLPTRSRPHMAHRDGRRFDGPPSLSGHCGHRPIFIAQNSHCSDSRGTLPKGVFAQPRPFPDIAAMSAFELALLQLPTSPCDPRFLRSWRWRRMFEKFAARMVLLAVNDEFVDEIFSVGCQITLLMPRHDIPSSDRCPVVHKR